MAWEAEGLYAYLFVTGAREGATIAGVVGELRELSSGEGPICFASEVAGSHKAIVRLRVAAGDMAGLQDFLGGQEYANVSFDWDRLQYSLVVEGPVYVSATNIWMPPKRPFNCDLMAFIRVSVEAGRARDVLGRLGDELGPTFHGAAIVYGDTDILLTLEAETLESVGHAVLGLLQQVSGVTRTETAFADIRRYDKDA